MSFGLNFQSNRDFLRYMALKIDVWTGSIITQKYTNFPKCRKKPNIVILKIHDRNRERLNKYVQITSFS